ncbi:MAG: DNA alkylation repair protein [Candidatus Woesearchaeota archaeon]
MLSQLQQELHSLKGLEKAKLLQRFFKTGKGEYGEGDLFLGITMPQQRIVAKKYFKEISLEEVEQLLHGKYHEERMTALIILTYKFAKASKEEQEKIYQLYLKNTKYINNWDLVDVTTPRIVGEYLLDKDHSILYTLAQSKDLWEKRISVLATFTFIREHQFEDALKIAEMLLSDKHDLIHKAVGWMLREIGKRDQKVEEEFLKKHYKNMPRTMLRYAIEKFEEEKRQSYLK